MSRREELIYEQMVAAGETEPIETVFFFPTREDVKIAAKWRRRLAGEPEPWTTIFRAVSERVAVPLHYLEFVRQFEKDRSTIVAW